MNKLSYNHNPEGDYRFVVMQNFLSRHNELPFWKKVPLKMYFRLKAPDLKTETAYGLDYSFVTAEKVPLIVKAAPDIPLTRVN